MCLRIIWILYGHILLFKSPKVVESSSDQGSIRSKLFALEPQSTPYYVKENDEHLTLPCAFTPSSLHMVQAAHWIAYVNEVPRVLTHGPENYASDHYDLDVRSCIGCYNLKVKRVQFELHNGRFYCQIGGENSATAHVIVLVKPQMPIITAVADQLSEGETKKVECQSSGGNPIPLIRWLFSNGSDVTHLSRQMNGTDSSHRTALSVLQWPVDALDHQSRLHCKVWNKAMNDDETSLEAVSMPLNVRFAPRVSVLPIGRYNVKIGHPATFRCNVLSNPPTLQYSWLFNNKRLEGKTTSELTVFPVTKQHAGNYTCQADNGNKIGQASCQLSILYPPEIVLPPEFHAALDRPFILTCVVDSNPPPSTVQWIRPDGRTSDGLTLRFDSISIRDAGNYSCVATNDNSAEGGGGGGGGVSRRTVMLYVDRAPGVATAHLPLTPVIRGTTARLICKAQDVGSPPARYRWRKMISQFSDQFSAPFIEADHDSDNALIIRDAKHTDSGIYACVAYNIVGQGQPGIVNLTIYEPAHIDRYMEFEDLRHENETGYVLNCTARGYPAPYITWYKNGEPLDINNTLSNDSDHWMVETRILNQCKLEDDCLYSVIGYLKWKTSVRWSDKGEIACGAFNGAGSIAFSKISLNVFHKPAIINDRSRLFVASDLDKPVEIRCKASSNPDPSFVWLRDQQIVKLNSNYSVSSHRYSSEQGVFESVLSIRRLQAHDTGAYECVASNRYGSESLIFMVQSKSKPNLPTDVQVHFKSHSSLTISWRPGFDGGLLQTFVLDLSYFHNATSLENIEIVDTTLQNGRDENFIKIRGVESVKPLLWNFTRNIRPCTQYHVRVKAKNGLGETDWTSYIIVKTDDSPLDVALPHVARVDFNDETSSFNFQPANVNNQLFCLMILRKFNAPSFKDFHSFYDCIDVSHSKFEARSLIADSVSPLSLKFRICRRYGFICGETYDFGELNFVDSTTKFSHFGWLALIGVCCILLVVLCAFCYCFCVYRRHGVGKAKNAAIKYSNRNGICNKKNPPIISGPFLTAKTPGPSSIFPTLNGHLAASKDSGVFTTGSCHFISTGNYSYESNGDGGGGFNANDDSRRLFEKTIHQRPSYAGSESCDFAPNSIQHHPFNSMTNYYPTHHIVETNPDPQSTPQKTIRDSGLSSAYSTPIQKRVIREIVV